VWSQRDRLHPDTGASSGGVLVHVDPVTGVIKQQVHSAAPALQQHPAICGHHRALHIPVH